MLYWVFFPNQIFKERFKIFLLFKVFSYFPCSLFCWIEGVGRTNTNPIKVRKSVGLFKVSFSFPSHCDITQLDV